MSVERQRAKEWCHGVLDVLAPIILFGGILIFILTPTDDCDKSFWQRCGVKVVTDNKTGKQYLVTSGGGIIERGK